MPENVAHRNTWDNFKRKYPWIFGEIKEESLEENTTETNVNDPSQMLPSLLSSDTVQKTSDSMDDNTLEPQFPGGINPELFENKTLGAPDYSKLTPEQKNDKAFLNKLWQEYFKLKREEFKVNCESGSAAACTSLAEVCLLLCMALCIDKYIRGIEKCTAARKTKRAEKLLRKVCYEQNHSHGCFWLGQIYLMGDSDLGRNNIEGYKAMKAGCDGEDGPSCSIVARMLLAGCGVERNVPDAVEYGSMSCERYNDGDSCSMLAELYSGMVKGLEEEERHDLKAAKYFKLACENNNATSCLNLSTAYNLGLGVKKNLKKRDKYFEIYLKLRELGA